MEDEKTAIGEVHPVAALDDHSRFCVGGQFVRRKSEAHILGALARWLRRFGLPAAILTDRATCFFGTGQVPSGTTTYHLALSALGIRAAFAAPYPPVGGLQLLGDEITVRANKKTIAQYSAAEA